MVFGGNIHFSAPSADKNDEEGTTYSSTLCELEVFGKIRIRKYKGSNIFF